MRTANEQFNLSCKKCLPAPEEEPRFSVSQPCADRLRRRQPKKHGAIGRGQQTRGLFFIIGL